MPNELGRRTVLQCATVAGAVIAGASWIGAAPATASSDSSSTTGCGPLDVVVLGDTTSEDAHNLTATLSDVTTGGLGQSARVLNPSDPVSFWGGTLAFDVAVAPKGVTYVTVRLWGDDHDSTSVNAGAGTDMWRLMLFCDGLQVGHEDQGAVDCLDIMDTSPRALGRFFFHTLPLPEKLTEGKETVRLEIRSMGRIWSYGATQAKLYYNMTTASRGIYRIYTHTSPYFVPSSGEAQGAAPENATRTSPGAEVMDTIKARVQSDQTGLLDYNNPWGLDAWGFQSMAEGYLWSGSPAYGQEAALRQVLQAIDGRYLAWQDSAAVLTGSDQQWQGFGRVGLVLALLWEHLGDLLDEPLTGSLSELVNPGFENGYTLPTGWKKNTWSGAGTFTRDTSVSRSGTASACLSVPSAGTIGFIPTRRLAVEQGDYTYTAWIKTSGVASKGAYIDVFFYDSSGTRIGSDHKAYVSSGTHDWEQAGITLTTPASASYAEVQIRVSGAGTAWFDDLAFTAPDGVTATEVPTRRAAYEEMLKASLSYWRQHFPHYSNQVIICAIGLYQANRGLRLLGSDAALSEDRILGYVRQAVGLDPWLGREDADGNPSKILGENYYVVTDAGLTRELGYVGSYGEVLDWLVMLWESITRGYSPQDPPAEIRKQIIKIIKTRGLFRVVDVDGDGYKIAKLESVIGWRNEVYPSEVAYASRIAWDSHPVMSAAVFPDPDIVGWTQEMCDDGQFYDQLDLLVSNTSRRVGLNALRLVSRDWDAFQALPSRPATLPTRWDADDFAFTDEENGVVALKNGQEILFASLYFRARQAVNNYARIHHLTPTDQRSGTIRQHTAGLTDDTYTVQDWILWDYAINDPSATLPAGGYPPPGDTLEQALAGDVHQLAPIPSDVKDPALGSTTYGVEKLMVGRAPLYYCEYGDYLIAMNTTTDKVFTLPAHAGFGPAKDLVGGKTIGKGQRPKIGPRTTMVLYRKNTSSS
ncbi:Tat pathway signal sequence domain protein [Streptomyces sp. NPDC051016]|uniref:Tat pathway signal sequence domain protein n=1 Tax=Streptomyces sp. NPDC051016 TaxID=3365638 RepID=UPI00378C6179